MSEPARILIVDDEPNVLRVITYALNHEGFETVVAQTGQEALDTVVEHRPDLVILDVMMPDMTGIEVCRRLRSDPANAALPIIILSARGQVADKIEGLEAGADEYVPKPVAPEEMVARVRALLARTERLSQEHATKRGKVLGFIGAKGGVGTTTMTLNVAAALAQLEATVIAAELSEYPGAFALRLARTPAANLATLLELEPEAIRRQELSTRLVAHPAGFQALFGPQHPGPFLDLTPAVSEAVVDGLAGMADHVLLDLAPVPSETNRAVLGRCDHVALVVEREPGAVWAASAMIDQLVSWDIARGVIGVVIVNRARLTVSMGTGEVAEKLGVEMLGVIPASEGFIMAQMAGTPLVVSQPDNAAVSSLRDLAAKVASGNYVSMRP